MSDDFVETKLIEITEPTADDIDDLVAFECHGCGIGISASDGPATDPLFVWAQPLGPDPNVHATVAVKAYHSRNCALADIDDWTKAIGRDVMVVHRVR